MKTRDQIISENPIEPYLSSRGIVLKGSGNERLAICPFHTDHTPSFSVNLDKQAWICRAGCGGGSIIDLMARLEGLDPKVIMKRLGETPEGYKPSHSGPPAQPKAEKGVDTAKTTKDAPTATQDAGRPKLVKAYDYRNTRGELVYQACRLEPGYNGAKKTFRQRRPNPGFDSIKGHSKENPQWIWNMDGMERVLYQLPKVLKTKGSVWIVAGEKDADNVTALGPVATTNVGGENHWMEAYSEAFNGKDVVLCGDNDKPGREHMEAVLESLAGKAKSVRVVTIPAPHKDVTDFLESLPSDPEIRFNALQKLVDEAPLFDRGVNLPLYTTQELRQQYLKSIASAETRSLDLGRWLPALGHSVRPLVGGEVLSIIAATKSGKTCCAQNLVRHAYPMKVLFFQQELPGSLMLERFTAIATQTDTKQVYHLYKSGDRSLDAPTDEAFAHVLTCTKSRLTVEKMDELIVKSELKFGETPAMAVVDYIQLCSGKGERYANVSDAAEGLKSLAVNRNIIILMLSQIARKDKDSQNPEVFLHDGKESGSIENSSGVVLGVWIDPKDATLMWIRILANTKGLPGRKIPCDFDGAKMLITERPANTVSESDKPKPKQPHKNE